MLKPISECDLSAADKIVAAVLRGWQAVDTENFAYLFETNGRGKSGLPKFVLVLMTDHGTIFEVRSGISSIIRAWTLEEAITIANQRLPRLQERAAQRKEVKS